MKHLLLILLAAGMLTLSACEKKIHEAHALLPQPVAVR